MINIKNRYLIIKELYNNYIILIKREEKYYSFEYDQDILRNIYFKKIKDIKKKKINYLVLDNLEIIELINYEKENKYQEYLIKSYLKNLLNVIKTSGVMSSSKK